jgi:hypothetical protein
MLRCGLPPGNPSFASRTRSDRAHQMGQIGLREGVHSARQGPRLMLAGLGALLRSENHRHGTRGRDGLTAARETPTVNQSYLAWLGMLKSSEPWDEP